MATAHETVPAQQVVDPVCEMTIDPADAVGHAEYEGKTYYFCSDSCRTQFRADPAQFAKPDRTSARSAAHQDVDTEYTCPMDPEVRRKGPGACPKCGMALEPAMAAPVTKTAWTCPMHPEIVRDVPGSCPICGMALEPHTACACCGR